MGVGLGGGQGGCEWRSEAFVKIKKKNLGEGGRVGGGGGGGGQGEWERRTEVFVKIQKKIYIYFFFFGGGGGGGGSGWGLRVDVYGEVKFL